MEKEKLLEKSKSYAVKEGFKLNPNKKIVDAIIKGLIKNKEKYGDYYCPCRIRRTKKEVCPCAYHKKEIKEKGKCLCGLFLRC